MRLYEISEEIRLICKEAEEGYGEISEEALEKLTRFELEFDQKAANIAALTRELDAECDAFQAEIDRLSRRQSAARNTSARLKKYLIEQMQASGKARVEHGTIRVSVVKNSQPAIEWNGEGVGPEGFVSSHTVERLNRIALMKHLKDGGECPPGITLTKSSHLRIT